MKVETVNKGPPVKCRECKQLIDSDLALFPGDADDAVSFIFPIISMQFNRLFKREVKSISAMFMITFTKINM